MKIILYFVTAFCLVNSILAQQLSSFKPAENWIDNNGEIINAHGGGILFHNGLYYWFGEHKIEGSAGNLAHVGVHCYSSKDLYNWKDEGIALSVIKDNANHPIAKGRIIERPKVIYNKKTKKFVMWFHLEPHDRETRIGAIENVKNGALSGIAISEKVTGPYQFVRAIHPNSGFWPINVKALHKSRSFPLERVKYFGGLPEHPDSLNLLGRDMKRGQQARDMTLFVDDDDKAYHIYSSEENSTMHIAELSDDYLNHTGKFVRTMIGEFREAPAVFKRNNKYYMITSGCTGWHPNRASIAIADSLLGEWKDLGNPCVGKDSEFTFHSQGNFVLKLADHSDRFIFLADRWNPENAIDGRYVWLPITFEDDRPTIKWLREWRLSFFNKQ